MASDQIKYVSEKLCWTNSFSEILLSSLYESATVVINAHG